MLSFKMLFVLVAAMCGSAAGLRTQQSRSTEEAVLLAAVTHIAQTRDMMQTAALDPRFAARTDRAHRGNFEGDMPPTVAENLSQVLKAELRRQEDVFVCGSQDPSTCSLRGAAVFLKLTHPKVSGQVATLWIDVLSAGSSKRSPVATVQHELRLELRGSDWVVVSDREVAVS